jgi:hypothetical protein
MGSSSSRPFGIGIKMQLCPPPSQPSPATANGFVSPFEVVHRQCVPSALRRARSHRPTGTTRPSVQSSQTDPSEGSSWRAPRVLLMPPHAVFLPMPMLHGRATSFVGCLPSSGRRRCWALAHGNAARFAIIALINDLLGTLPGGGRVRHTCHHAGTEGV